jgi:hypothetical protein
MDAVQIIVTQGAVEAAGPGAAGAAALAWFGGKVFGPSAEALGENLRAFLAHRVSKVFAKAGEMGQDLGIEPQPIRPGLLTRMIMDASFSEDTAEITDWWANLFLDASVTGSNEHAVFSDIMALLGPAEAQCLTDFIRSFQHGASPSFGKSPPWIVTLGSKFEGAVEIWMRDDGTPGRNARILNNFMHGDPSWPMRPTEWRIFVDIPGGESSLMYGHNPWFTNNLLPLDILTRAGLLATLSSSYSVFGGSPWVRGIGLTTLGYNFYAACIGARYQPSVS